GGQAGLHVGAAASPQFAVADLAAERVDGPLRQVALGDDVGVALEHQGGPVASAALDHGDHVGPAGRGLVHDGLPAPLAHLGGDEVGGGLLAAAPRRVVGAGDADQRLGELHDALGVHFDHSNPSRVGTAASSALV